VRTSARCKVWDRAGEVSSKRSINQGVGRGASRSTNWKLLQVSKHARCVDRRPRGESVSQGTLRSISAAAG